ncbi:uncharacterized protein TNCV_678311 [Trichonephila clavipes]|nr:uncharacterized protein TNCV_678311 [Trichonephila clavipes]
MVRLIAHNQSFKGLSKLSLDIPTKDTGNLPPHQTGGLLSPTRPGGVKSQIRDMFSIRPVVRHICKLVYNRARILNQWFSSPFRPPIAFVSSPVGMINATIRTTLVSVSSND